MISYLREPAWVELLHALVNFLLFDSILKIDDYITKKSSFLLRINLLVFLQEVYNSGEDRTNDMMLNSS